MAAVQAGDRVQIHYTGRFANGKVFDTSEGRDPLEFEAGSEDLIPGVSGAVVGMEEGEEKTVVIAPEDGYGARDPGLVQSVPKSSMPDDVEVGDRLRAQADEQEFAVWVREIGDDTVLVDANHPLAGETLEFDLKVVSITPA